MRVYLKRLARPLLVHLPGGIRNFLFMVMQYLRFWDWCAAHLCPESPTRELFYGHVMQRAGLNGPIDYLEFGVYQGASIKWWLENNSAPASSFVGFDTFEGLPEDWTHQAPKGTFSTGGVLPDTSDSRARFLKGLFQQTLPPFLEQHRRGGTLVVHLDADLYSSTLFVLITLAPRLRSGDVLLFDEFCYPMHEYRAFEDCMAAYPLPYDLLARTKEYKQVAIIVRAPP
jgi:O-methyltransferase